MDRENASRPIRALLTDRLVGTWRLVSFVGHGADGRQSADYGPTPRGCLMYDKGGRMSVHITAGSEDGYFGYFGTYTVDESAGTVTHHVEGAFHPEYAGTDQRRFFKWQGDRLVLSTEAGQDVTYVATWERQV